jgi:hypothetical protein
MGLYELTQVMDKWKVLVNSVMNIRFHKMLYSSRVATLLVASRLALNYI